MHRTMTKSWVGLRKNLNRDRMDTVEQITWAYAGTTVARVEASAYARAHSSPVVFEFRSAERCGLGEGVRDWRNSTETALTHSSRTELYRIASRFTLWPDRETSLTNVVV